MNDPKPLSEEEMEAIITEAIALARVRHERWIANGCREEDSLSLQKLRADWEKRSTEER